MAPKSIDIPFGGHRKEGFDEKLSKDDKDAFAKNFPEKTEVELPWWGKQTFEIRKSVRAFLDQLPYPTFNATFEVEGDCASEKNVTIECTKQKMTGTDHGSFQVVNIGISYQFEAEVEEGDYATVECACPDSSVKGWRRTRKFTVEWYLKIDMNPGVGGTYPVESQEITVRAPCCGCPDKSSTSERPRPRRRPQYSDR